ncbi:DUF3850 domain-containing protein [Ensifer sp. ENS12]|uniref:DUF3850 domain-containing protein n=1 Tax=Ensifer sp. ENS12 TaxID=2854774 RepID=UPI001C497753|nr:DUF3850 domain-containing protein [Ensifer sp. ENS12]MBV7522578.1 DUF3850 domain-containing protein [Ensifer sp. ENS12]
MERMTLADARNKLPEAAKRPQPVLHKVKSWPHLFEATLSGAKTHDMRRATDRDYQVGDVLCLQEFEPSTESYTGRELYVRITYVTSSEFPCALSGEGLSAGYCILSIKPVSSEN